VDLRVDLGGRRIIKKKILKCVWNDGTRTEARFRLSAKRTSPFKSAGASVQSTTGSRGVRISGSISSNDGYTMFQGSVKGTGYPLHSPVSPSLSLPCVAVCHHVSMYSTSYVLRRRKQFHPKGWKRPTASQGRINQNSANSNFCSVKTSDLLSVKCLSAGHVDGFNSNICSPTIPVAARSKAWVYGRSLAGIVGSNPAGDMDVCLFWMLCVVRDTSLRRADRSSRGVLPSVVCLSVIVKPQQWRGPGPLATLASWKERSIDQ
jgi:hypothetical protein